MVFLFNFFSCDNIKDEDAGEIALDINYFDGNAYALLNKISN